MERETIKAATFEKLYDGLQLMREAEMEYAGHVQYSLTKYMFDTLEDLEAAAGYCGVEVETTGPHIDGDGRDYVGYSFRLGGIEFWFWACAD